MRRDEEEALYRYAQTVKPFVLVMAPQCTGMAGWRRCSAKVNPGAHNQPVEASLTLGYVCAVCAILQMEGGRHLFLEQPRGSDLLQTEPYQYLARMPGVIWCYMHMCMVGLVSVVDG